jgi:hypothetical protein
MLWVLTAVLIAVACDSQRDYWFLLLNWTLVFPLSVVADRYAFVLRYDAGFFSLAWRVPAMAPFAFGWFFTLPSVLIRSMQGIGQLALHERLLILSTILVARGFFTERLGVKQRLWSYHWSPPGCRWRGVPVIIPFIDATACVLLFLLHGHTVRMTAEMGWMRAFVVSYLIYAGAFAAFASTSWLLIRRLLGVQPTSM